VEADPALVGQAGDPLGHQYRRGLAKHAWQATGRHERHRRRGGGEWVAAMPQPPAGVELQRPRYCLESITNTPPVPITKWSRLARLPWMARSCRIAQWYWTLTTGKRQMSLASLRRGKLLGLRTCERLEAKSILPLRCTPAQHYVAELLIRCMATASPNPDWSDECQTRLGGDVSAQVALVRPAPYSLATKTSNETYAA
jgi:hypothetical protein